MGLHRERCEPGTVLCLPEERTTVQKNDSYDAQCVERVAINELNKLPDAMPEDMYWTLGQLVNRRANLKTHHIRLKNQLHEQVCVAYPSYKQFFQDIGRPTALYFWEHYPSPRLLREKTVEDLAEELIPVSHNQFSTRKCQKILDAVKADGDTKAYRRILLSMCIIRGSWQEARTSHRH